jgi:hypothetical protein
MIHTTSPILRRTLAAAAAALALVGCKSDPGPTTCVDGTEGCPCLADSTCTQPGGDVVLACVSDVCQRVDAPDPGELNGACDETIACSTYEGQQLDCIEGTCQLPDCLSGLVGCPCAALATCDDPTVDGEACVDGICQVAGCEPGSLGCACGEGGACNAGLECVADICRSADGVWLTVGDPAVRACDVLLAANGGRVGLVTFEATVLGETMSRAPRTAVSFSGRADATLVGDVARIELLDTVAGAAVTVESATCYDSLGQAITGSPVSVR